MFTVTNPVDATQADTEPSSPVIAGNWLDDDGIVMDDLLRNQSDPPLPSALPGERFVVPAAVAAPTTRLLSRNYSYPKTGTDPIMVLPPDANRKRVLIRCDSAVAIASDRNDLNADCSNAWICVQSSDGMVIEGHTGAVWIAPYDTATRAIGGSGNFAFTVMAVTS